MSFVAVRWHHSSPDYPVELYSELDSERWEVRKIDIFSDGHIEFADKTESCGNTDLSSEPIPPLSEIAADPEFEPREISAEEFERLWSKRRK